jgi:hypothetical protein
VLRYRCFTKTVGFHVVGHLWPQKHSGVVSPLCPARNHIAESTINAAHTALLVLRARQSTAAHFATSPQQSLICQDWG